MKWFFFLLLCLNLLFASIQWWNIRGGEAPRSYTHVKDVKPLVLLQESTPNASSSVSSLDADQQCELIGPMNARDMANNLLSLLSKEGVSAELVVQQVKKAPGYWVYYGPVAEESDRQDKWLEFQTKGIDSYLITSGKLKGAISVGVFENIDSAQRIQKKMSDYGYLSNVSEIEKTSEAYWLLVYGGYLVENKKKIDTVLDALQARPEKRQIFCKSVASEKQFP